MNVTEKAARLQNYSEQRKTNVQASPAEIKSELKEQMIHEEQKMSPEMRDYLYNLADNTPFLYVSFLVLREIWEIKKRIEMGNSAHNEEI